MSRDPEQAIATTVAIVGLITAAAAVLALTAIR